MASKETRQQELMRIQERDGCLRASVLVAESKPKSAPLHSDFEWDDKKAGHEFRLSQARRIIKVTRLREKTGEEIRWLNVPVSKIDTPTAVIQEREGIYKPVNVVVKEPEDYRKCLEQLIKQRNAMDQTIHELQKAAKKHGKPINLMTQLVDGLEIVKTTLSLMMKAA